MSIAMMSNSNAVDNTINAIFTEDSVSSSSSEGRVGGEEVHACNGSPHKFLLPAK